MLSRLALILLITACSPTPTYELHQVNIIGEMRNVMRKGELGGRVDLDTISNKDNLYGLGPVEYLAGEILILYGKAYKSTVVSDTEMKVEETYQMMAPFFGYANIPSWTEQELPDSITSIKDLEQYLERVTKNSSRPFMFKLTGEIDHALIHIVNLPKGSKVSSPEEAHQGQQDYRLQDESATILGFFSTEHKAIFTHHDTYLHMHLITEDRKKMGHLDEVEFGKGSMRLYLPE